MDEVVLRTSVPDLPVRRGKVRDVYDLGDGRLVIVATDRVSAFDHVLPNGIPGKGRVLTRLTRWWLDIFAKHTPTHFLTDDVREMPAAFRDDPAFAGRSMLVEKCNVIPVECVVRGYLAGAAWAEYRRGGTVGGKPQPPGLQESMRLYEPLFTPTTKVEAGHDEPIASREELVGRAGSAYLADAIEQKALDLYAEAARTAWAKGIILADTKFEFAAGEQRGKPSIVLVDEVLTPDSSRYWPVDAYRVGASPPSLDKQYIRDYLTRSGWDRQSPPPPLPEDVVAMTADLYQYLARRIMA